MAVIYLPPNQDNIAGNLGQGVGQGVSAFMERELKRQEQAQLMARQAQALNAVKNAKTREEALGVLTFPGAVNNPQELANAMRFIDALHPPKDETPQMVTAYDQKTGKKQERFVKKSDLPTLNDPNKVHELFGPNAGLNEPSDVQDFFSNDGKQLGKAPLSARPQGAMTKEEFSIAEKKGADARSEQHLKIAEENSRRQVSAAERSASASERAAHGAELKDFEAYRRAAADMLNIKRSVGADGSFNLDFDGDTKKQKQYYDMIDKYDNYLKKYGSVSKAVVAARKEVVDPEVKRKEEEAAKPKPAVKEPEKGGVSKILNDIGSKFKKQEKPKEGLGKQDGAYVVASKADYDKLESGDEYIDPRDGKRKRKK